MKFAVKTVLGGPAAGPPKTVSTSLGLDAGGKPSTLFPPGGLVDLSNFRGSLLDATPKSTDATSKVEFGFNQNFKISKFSAEVIWRIKFFSARKIKRTSIFCFLTCESFNFVHPARNQKKNSKSQISKNRPKMFFRRRPVLHSFSASRALEFQFFRPKITFRSEIF